MSYPEHVITVEEAIAKIRKAFSDPSMRVERFSFECITPSESTLKMKWDRKAVGQPASVKATLE